MIEIDKDTWTCLATFEKLTNAVASDCIMEEGKIAFIVKKGQLGKAIGKSGANINKVRSVFKGRRVIVVEDADGIEQFIKNLFQSINVKDINIHERMNSKIAYVTVSINDRGSAIGRDGEKIKMNRALLQRKFDCDLKLRTE